MAMIIPSILSADFTRLGDELRAVEAAGADWIHVDVMDGHFVPNLTMGPMTVEAVRRVTKLPIDVHLMIDNPDEFIEKFAAAGATHISVHAESVVHLNRSLQLVRSCGAHPGIALGPAAPLSLLDWSVENADYVLLLAVNPGFRRPGVPAGGTGKDPGAPGGARPPWSCQDHRIGRRHQRPHHRGVRGRRRGCLRHRLRYLRGSRLPGHFRPHEGRGAAGRGPHMISLRNELWSARVSETGAELKSLASAPTGQEYIWNGDPAWWNGSAPVLFPVIGGLKGGEYSYEGRTYKLPSHGFARTSEFAVTRSSADSVELTLASGPKTRESYPFDFRLSVGVQLEHAGVAVRYCVTNTGTARMYFSIGSHPAFVVPFAGGALENYYVLFDREENLERWFFKDGMIVAGKTEEVLENRRTLNLSRTTFDQGIMIFKHPVSREFTIANSRNSRAITVVTEGVPSLGVWSKPGGAPFLCIEPWHGIPDMSDTSGSLVDKEGILGLEPGAAFSTGYRVEIT